MTAIADQTFKCRRSIIKDTKFDHYNITNLIEQIFSSVSISFSIFAIHLAAEITLTSS